MLIPKEQGESTYRTFDDTTAGNSGEDKYHDGCNKLPRKTFLAGGKPLNFKLVSGIRPFRVHWVKTKSEKQYLTGCHGFNPLNEEWDKVNLPCPACEAGMHSIASYLVNVLVIDWANNPSLNPHTDKNPIAVLELTAGMIAGIQASQVSWGGIKFTDIETQVELVVIGSKTSSKISYNVSAVPATCDITKEWLSDYEMWDLDKYADSMISTPEDMMSSLVYNGYFDNIEVIKGFSDKYVASPYWPEYTEENWTKLASKLSTSFSNSEGSTSGGSPADLGSSGVRPPPKSPPSDEGSTPPPLKTSPPNQGESSQGSGSPISPPPPPPPRK